MEPPQEKATTVVPSEESTQESLTESDPRSQWLPTEHPLNPQ